MQQARAEGQPRVARTVDNVDVLKAMADPTRLAILAALMKTRHDLPVMSVKELAAELGEPQTKLYRHVRQLETAGLIKVASTRMVSGILEQRYQACQQELLFGDELLQEHADESDAAVRVLLERYFAGFRAAKVAEASLPAAADYRKPVLVMSDLRVSPAKAAELRSRLRAIIDEFHDDKLEDPDGVPLNLLISCFISAERSEH